MQKIQYQILSHFRKEAYLMFGMPPSNLRPPGMLPNVMGPFSPNSFQPQKVGLLARLFGTNPTSGAPGFMGMIQNAEKMIQVAQTVKPMIEQYGPLAKNLPSMLQLLKEYQNYSSSSDEKQDETESKKEPESKSDQKPKSNKTDESGPVKKKGKKIKLQTIPSTSSSEEKTKKSVPKLYI
jgi:hypothetical protein